MRGTIMKTCLLAAATTFAVLVRLVPLHASEPLDLYDKEIDAVHHCGRDAVVWLDVPSRTYWMKNQRDYGRTKSGGYTCRTDAAKSGNHATRG
jgi:hypothetical protein